jgi:4-hydroxybenzoate polyprenyltransferase
MTARRVADLVRAYVVTMRPYLLFLSGITGLAGLALGPETGAGRTWLAGGAFFLSYGFGQALTDCFQMDTDALSAPYRPLVQGRLARGPVLGTSLGGLLLCGLILVWYHPANVALAVLTVGGLATYTWFKRRWWGGPFYNAWIVALLVVMGYFVAAGWHATAQVPGDLGGVLLLAFFGYANFVLTGYYKDIPADRATGYRTLPVVFGLGVSAFVSDAFALAAVTGALLAARSAVAVGPVSPQHIIGLLLLSAGVVTTVVGQVRLHRVRGAATAYHAIVPVVHAYVLLLAGVTALHRPGWAAWLLVFYAAFTLALARRPEREQI